MKSGIVFALIGLGFLLLMLSGFWTTLFTGTSTWTPEKAARQEEIHRQLHNLAFVVGGTQASSMHQGPERGKAKQQYDQLKKEADSLAAELDSARNTPQTVAKILKWSGISLAILGIIGWYAVNQSR
jgi:hypothetical protein